ncbi:MAG: fibronectin type III domain-containing protein [Anaerolineae bacterium]|nr:fibronectin type III domain-containing protein [Anaerolineae bacterium]
MNRKIIFVIVILSTIALSSFENYLKKNGIEFVIQQPDTHPTITYVPVIWKETEATGNSILLKWEDANEDIQYYTIYRKVLGEKEYQYFHRVESDFVPGRIHRLRDASIEPGKEYLYTVIATTGHGDVEGSVLDVPVRIR